jgi:hypothetical protein
MVESAHQFPLGAGPLAYTDGDSPHLEISVSYWVRLSSMRLSKGWCIYAIRRPDPVER